MILHAAEIWAALAGCFILGALVGSIFHRAIALTGANRAQASLIRGIDRVVRALERILLPWRGTVPAILPQTVPVPPPDFSPVPVIPEVHPVMESLASGPVEIDPFPSERLAEAELLPPVSYAYAHLDPATASDPASHGDASGFQPLSLPGPRQGVADPLHAIVGLTKRHAGRLAEVGIYHFSQIASWTPQEVAWIAAYLQVGDAIVSKDWVGQAMHFASSDEPIVVPERVRKAPVAAKPKSRPKRSKGKAEAVGETAALQEQAPTEEPEDDKAATGDAPAKPARKKRAESKDGDARQAKPRARRRKSAGSDRAASPVPSETGAAVVVAAVEEPASPEPGPREGENSENSADHRREP
ncbi:hypothetical protein K32_17540 [Kaistia sp. 32K]|uniref:hypothetical protein n=1 Tax=Kaistia sp. 32K TaxID=2795690 RepID=UPI001916C2A1|nr:hypothetical protein [Kaistia sp. 32K]BCP53137.1 hypothetical protein K32_17540 [Kaistia sp. 32K]